MSKQYLDYNPMRQNIFILLVIGLILCLAACKKDTPSTTTTTTRSLETSIKKQEKTSENSNQKMSLIPAGTLHMGGDNEQADENEFPKHKVEIQSFWMDKREVSNAEYLAFTEATNYITVAERPIIWEEIKKTLPPGTPQPPDSVMQPGALVFQSTPNPVALNNPAQWWRWTIGASWRNPDGPASTIKDRLDHPVVQIAWEDAMAYAKWANKRLPTEAEWEWASRGGLKDAIYPWGNESVNEGKIKANFWQGLFPFKNELKDGYLTTAPVGSFPANGYGLFDMSGNVWEWCADWYDVTYYKKEGASKANSIGPASGINPTNPYEPHKVLRGGSFLCSDSYCSGYRNARRMGSSVDTGLNHTGFRCVREVE